MFGSDNQAPAHPAVLAAIAAANEGRAGSYGDDPWTRRAEDLVRDVFATDDLDLLLVTTGGAANGLALSLLCPPWAAVLAHAHAHVLADEGSGPELFTGGARLVGLAPDAPRLMPEHVEAALDAYPRGFVHGPQPRAVTVTNLSEHGLALDAGAMRALGDVCRACDLRLHVDGARLANAVAATSATPADLTWRAGVDVVSLGLTKTGALMAEAVVVFGQTRNGAAGYQRKRAGQLASKHRFLSAQFVAMLEGGLWLDLAGHANAVARALGEALCAKGCALIHPVEGNEVFAVVPEDYRARLEAAGVGFYPWPALGPDACRFVAAWNSSLDVNVSLP
jgi:threonine aldolase